MKKLFLIIAILCFCVSAKATHLAGGEIWYSHVSDSTYKVHYRLYRDCSGQSAQTKNVLYYRSVSLGLDSSLVMLRDTSYFNNTCPNTSCESTTSSILGIEINEYSAIVIFPPAMDWQMRVLNIARNPSYNLSSTTSGGLYVEATLDNSVLPNNSSLPFVPINMRQNSGVQNTFNFPMLDPDGDVLEIEFVNPLGGAGSPTFTPTFELYTNGATINNPFASTPPPTLNSATGNITLFPCLQGDYTFAVIIREYRNSVLIGTAMRDYLFSFVNNANYPPALTGINNTYNMDTTIEVCPTNNFTFVVNSTDSNVTDSTFIFCQSKPTGATFSAGPGQNEIGYFQWTPGLAEVRTQPYIVAFKVKDNQCAEQSYGYRIYVKQCKNLSVNDKQKETAAKLYPNPTRNYLSLELDDWISGGNYNFSIFDISGRRLRSGNIDNKNTQLNIKSLSPSVYFLEVSKNQEKLDSFKFIKE